MADIISFTGKGLLLALKIKRVLGEEGPVYTKFSEIDKRELPERVVYVEEKLGDWTNERFENHTPIVFIGACGIAVRTIAPYVRDKFSDIPVIVLDENGKFCIPLLSAHIGGAKKLAETIAEKIGAVPVITTATDVNDLFAVDVFAAENDLLILNREGVKKVSSKILAAGEVTMRLDGGKVKGRVPDEVKITKKKKADIIISPRELEEGSCLLQLVPKAVYAGIGCRKDKPEADIRKMFYDVLEQNGIERGAVAGAATIDIKEHEPGLRQFVRAEELSFQTFPAEVLKEVQGEFSVSDFVSKTVGVDNVCERAAAAACGKNYRLLVPKNAGNGVTAAFAVKDWSVRF